MIAIKNNYEFKIEQEKSLQGNKKPLLPINS